MKGLQLLIFLVGLACTSVSAQVSVQGTVLDEDGLPLVGVTVVELGSGTGTLTDIDVQRSVYTCIGFAVVDNLI